MNIREGRVKPVPGYPYVVQQTNLPFQHSSTFSATLAWHQHNRVSTMSECDEQQCSHSWLEVSVVVADAELIDRTAAVTVS